MTASALPSTDACPRRVLVVDDEEIVMVALCQTLRRQGYDVITASNAVQALELLRTQQFGVILTDQQMPMLTGLEFLAQARLLQPDASRILITAVLSLGTIIDAINKAEVFRFVLKPWDRDDLLQIMEHAWQRYEAVCRDHLLLQQSQEANARLARSNEALQRELAAGPDRARALRPPSAG